MVGLIFFDVYYTLIDISNVDNRKLDEETWLFLKENGFDIPLKKYLNISDEVYSKWRRYRLENLVDVNCRVWWQEILLKLNIPAKPSFLESFINNRYKIYRKNIRLYPDVKETLEYLKENNKSLGVITNSSDGALVRDDLALFGIKDYFDILIISSELKLRKPNSKLYDTILNMLPYGKSDIIVVGDDYDSDVKPWIKRGVSAYLINRNANIRLEGNEISSLLELKNIVK